MCQASVSNAAMMSITQLGISISFDVVVVAAAAAVCAYTFSGQLVAIRIRESQGIIQRPCECLRLLSGRISNLVINATLVIHYA